MHASQWFALLFAVAIFAGLAAAFVFKGAKIKGDKSRKIEDWPRITQGGGPGA